MVDTQAAMHGIPHSKSCGRLPHMYKNREDLFQTFETRGSDLYETPITLNRPYNRHEAPVSLQRIQELEEMQTDDKASRIFRHPPNDAGPNRAVGSVNSARDAISPPHGLIYHPQGNPRGFERAPIEPMSRQGHRTYVNFRDGFGSPALASTWPPRSQDAEELTRHEERFDNKCEP